MLAYVKKLGRGLVILAAIGGVALAVFLSLFLVTGQTGFKLLIVRSGSMEPAIETGSLLLIKPVKSVGVGDIVTYKNSAGQLITHRVVAIEDGRYITKGDANDSWDSPIDFSKIVGGVVTSLPSFGRFLGFARTPWGYALTILLPSLALIVNEVIAIAREFDNAERRRRRIIIPITTAAIVLLLSAGMTNAAFTDQVQITNNTFQTAQFPADHLVINEVFFFVDDAHGLDCSAAGTGNASNSNTGPGSTNTASVSVRNRCTVSIENSADTDISVDLDTDTGGNACSGNTAVGDCESGDITVNFDFSVTINQFGGTFGQSDEWIEVHNPTGVEINLKDWRVVDNSGIERIIHGNRWIGPGGFALIAKSASTFSLFWDVPDGVLIIPLGHPIGNGLSNLGDRVGLVDPTGAEIDMISWGTDTTLPHFDSPIVQGHSIERLSPGFDTDVGTDFQDHSPPTPGI